MESQLRTYALASLLRRYPKNCLGRHHARSRIQTAPRRSNHLPSFCIQAPLPAPRNCERFHTQQAPSAEHGESCRQAYLTKFDSTSEYNSPAGQNNVDEPVDPRRGEGKRFAILGSGISGLASAIYIRCLFPAAQITIYEATDRHGGWIRSKQVPVDDGHVTFELGPRAMMPHRPNSLAALHLIMDMGLASEVTWKRKDDPVSRNRFIYYPDRLVKMPGGDQDIYQVLTSLITEPIFKGLFKGIIHEVRAPARGHRVIDEAVSAFLERRFGSPDIGNNIVSAVIHGIYGGDIDRLSTRSVMKSMWEVEEAERSILLGSITSQLRPKQQQDIIDLSSSSDSSGFLAMLQESARSYSLKGGLQTFPDRLAKGLENDPKTEFRMREKVTRVEYDAKSDGILISTSRNQPPIKYHHCISALPARSLATLTPHLPSLANIHSVSVMVVNLFYRDPNLLGEHGFGYLIPRSVPVTQNPECALGVTFDSFIGTGVDTVPGTKLSVMLGGHYWDGFSYSPTNEEGIAMAQSLVKRHLGIDEEPAAALATLNKNCIPQYYLGHEIKLAKANEALASEFNGRLSVVGSSYGGVGVNDCIFGAHRLARQIARHPEEKSTGLEVHRFNNK